MPWYLPVLSQHYAGLSLFKSVIFLLYLLLLLLYATLVFLLVFQRCMCSLCLGPLYSSSKSSCYFSCWPNQCLSLNQIQQIDCHHSCLPAISVQFFFCIFSCIFLLLFLCGISHLFLPKIFDIHPAKQSYRAFLPINTSSTKTSL